MLTRNTSARAAVKTHYKKVKSLSIQFGACVNIHVAKKTGLLIHKDLIWKPDRLLNYHRNIPDFSKERNNDITVYDPNGVSTNRCVYLPEISTT